MDPTKLQYHRVNKDVKGFFGLTATQADQQPP